MSQPQAPGEPSMEDILASIRRIIADNGRGEETEAAEIPPPMADIPADAAGDHPLILTRALPEEGAVLTVAPGEAGQGEIIAVEEALLLTEPLAAAQPVALPAEPEAASAPAGPPPAVPSVPP